MKFAWNDQDADKGIYVLRIDVQGTDIPSGLTMTLLDYRCDYQQNRLRDPERLKDSRYSHELYDFWWGVSDNDMAFRQIGACAPGELTLEEAKKKVEGCLAERCLLAYQKTLRKLQALEPIANWASGL